MRLNTTKDNFIHEHLMKPCFVIPLSLCLANSLFQPSYLQIASRKAGPCRDKSDYNIISVFLAHIEESITKSTPIVRHSLAYEKKTPGILLLLLQAECSRLMMGVFLESGKILVHF